MEKVKLLKLLSTMILKFAGHTVIPACRQWSSGWQTGVQTRNGLETYRFTSILEWRYDQHDSASDVRKEWYSDYADGMRSYDRLGHQVDALRMLAVVGVKSRFIALKF